ncbi:MAG: hypothetical protein DME40_16120 [Verrucomicrobia bacterium]|nr:MAG: hypothetical protein DME40_16120 [Verrucomicrobiota bacterium]PYL76223.1 MAG: hypothetical protein DMF27_09535 [Verrucomicrobiota bacterium]PYM10219.1 MAG: hypothetical protein DMF15_02825 [Verrucomicrobiota bacterium]
MTPAGLPAEGSILKQVGHHTIDCIEALRIFFVRLGLCLDWIENMDISGLLTKPSKFDVFAVSGLPLATKV